MIVLGQTRAELVKGIALFRSRQAGNDVTGQFSDFRFAHRVEIVQRLTLFFSRVIRFSAFAFQDMQLESRKRDLVKTQRFRAVFQGVLKVGTRPVEDRHEVVAYGVDTAFRQVADALLIVSNPGLVLARTGFDIFVHRNTFDDGPGQPFFRQQRLTRFDFFYRPHLTVRDMVQCRDYAGSASLTHIIKRYRIVRAVPTPGLFHCLTSKVVIPIKSLLMTTTIHVYSGASNNPPGLIDPAHTNAINTAHQFNLLSYNFTLPTLINR